MKIIGNILWFILSGFISALLWFLLGLLWCITIVGIPFGIQCFKFASLTIWPFGRTAESNFSAHPIANILWFILGGFSLFFGYLIEGLFWCITIIGFPFGKQCFKLAVLSFAPFGATIRKI